MDSSFGSILTDAEKAEIYKMLIDIFGDETSKNFSLTAYQAAVNSILQDMEIEEHTIVKNYNNQSIKYIRYNMSRTVAKRNVLAAKGYMLIFKLREYLLN